MNIRLALESDLPDLAELYRQTVFANAHQYYTPEQTTAWAASASNANAERFRHFILDVVTYVAEDTSGIIGFAGIAEDGHVASAYTRHDCLGQGIGSTLMQVVLDHAQNHGIPRLYAEASEFSLGLFKKFGFELYDTEVVEHQGAWFNRYLVALVLQTA